MIYFSDFGGGGGPSIPTYRSNAFYDIDTDSGAGDDLIIPWPSLSSLATEIAAGTVIAMVHVTTCNAASTVHTIGTPSGFTSAHEGQYKDQFRHGLFWRRLDGTESGNITVPINNGATSWTICGTVSIWRGCKATGTPYEQLTTSFGENSTLVSSAMTTTGPERRVLCFASYDAEVSATPAGGYAEEFGHTTPSGASTSGGVECLYKRVQLPGSVASQNHSKAHSRWGSITLALLPAAEHPIVIYATTTISSSAATSLSPTYYTAGTPTFTLSGGSLPPGLSLNSSTGAITGTASSTGTYSGIQIQMSASDGTVTSDPFTLTVVAGVDEYELRFFGSNDGAGDVLIRELTMATSHGGVDITTGRPTTGSPGIYSGSEGPDKAINNNTGDWWQPRCSPAASGQVTFGITFASVQDVKEITLDPHPSFLTRTPKAMDVYGRISGGSWGLIQSFSGWTSWSGTRTLQW